MCIIIFTNNQTHMATLEDITKAVEERRNAIFSGQSQLAVDEVSQIKDASWVMGSFMMGKLNSDTLDKVDIQNRGWSSANLTFFDSSLGGSYAINTRPQFTTYADIPVKGKVPGRKDPDVMHGSYNETNANGSLSLGTGRYFHEAIAEPSQVIHMRFGTPEFNSMTQFLTSFFNEDAARVARSGRVSSTFYNIGNFAGTVINVIYWPLLAAQAVGAALRFLFKKPASSFYYSRPSMPTYWMAVNTMLNQIITYKGLYPFAMDAAADQRVGEPYNIDKAAMEGIANAMPDIFSKEGGIDVLAVANRAQRMKRVMEQSIINALRDSEDFEGFVKKIDQDSVNNPTGKIGIKDYITRWTELKIAEVTKSTDQVEKSLRVNNKDGTTSAGPNDWSTFLQAELDDGLAWATFKVEATGPVSESFGNNFVESDLAQKMNDASAKSKSFYFATAGGNVTETIGAVVGAAADFAKGVLDSFSASGLVALAGSAFVNIPKHWENSTAQMPRTTYTMKLVAPYGNVISRIINIDVALCMILVAALPKSAGKQAYTWPFLIELYDRGRKQTRLGMIDSLTVTRGTTNLAFNKEGEYNGVEISFSVMPMDNIIGIPISAGFSINPAKGVFDDDNMYSDYMNVLASVSLSQQVYVANKLRLRLAAKLKSYQNLISKSSVSAVLHSIPVIGDIDIIYKGTER
jgi:hypothetical protein